MNVTAVILDKLTVVGYRLEDDEGNELRINSETFIDLVKNNKIDGVSIVEFEGSSYLSGLKLRDLRIDSQLSVTITKKELDNNSVIGYKVIRTGDKDEKSISIQKAWELASTDCISNAKALFTGDSQDLKKYIKCDI